MPGFLKSDLTYSLGGGFLLGAMMLFFAQPVEHQSEVAQTLSTTVAAASQMIG